MLRALWSLLRLGCTVGFNMRSPYWQWRHQTAFGTNPSTMPSPRERRRAVLEYGEWVAQMRKLMR